MTESLCVTGYATIFRGHTAFDFEKADLYVIPIEYRYRNGTGRVTENLDVSREYWMQGCSQFLMMMNLIDCLKILMTMGGRKMKWMRKRRGIA